MGRVPRHDLDVNLSRRRIDTIILGGVATNIGVESTARDALERGFKLLLVEDAMAIATATAHEMSVKTIFPRIGHVYSAADVLAPSPGDDPACPLRRAGTHVAHNVSGSVPVHWNG